MSDEEEGSSAASDNDDFEKEEEEEETPKKKKAKPTPRKSVASSVSSRATPRRAAARKSFKEESSESEEEEEEEEEEDDDNQSGSGSGGDSDEEEEEEEDSSPRKRAKRTPTKQKGSDEEEDDESPKKKRKSPVKKAKKETPAAKKKKAAAAAKAKAKKGKAAAASPAAKKKAAKAKESPSPVKKKKAANEETGGGMVRAKKPLSKMKQLDNAMKSYKWWEAEQLPEGLKWRSLEHNGVQFPPPYKPHNAAFFYDGQKVDLSPAAEEVATYFAACIGSQQLEKESTAKTFTSNFFKQFKTFLPTDSVVKDFALCDFGHIRAHLDAERDRKKEQSKEEKEAKKLDEEKKKLKYMYAVVDGTLMKIANTLIEPPGLFRGRGEHPKAGLLKPRVMPEDVTLNIGEDAPVPECPLEGHSWGRIIHNHHTTWLANWKDMSGNNKYVYLSASSHFKGQTDREKYEKARRLKKKIPEIRSNYMKGMESGETSKDRQIATAMWIIDRLALRVGGEKEEDEADTVGTCSLRVEHIMLDEPCTMTLDFLGKDSMRHFQKYDLNEPHLEKSGLLAFKCLKSFIKDKKGTDQIFDQVDPTLLNEHLKKIMPGLTAKVFRTYNASSTLEAELPKRMPASASVEEKESAYNDANRTVAILCNHQRSVSKAQEVGLEKKQAEISELEKQLDELRVMQKMRNKNKSIELRPAEVADEDKRKFAHMFEKEPSADQVDKRVAQWEKKLDQLKYKTSEADKNKTVALNTSKINYMDPRISVAWAKRNEFPIEKIYSATQRDKFPWAMSEKESFEF